MTLCSGIMPLSSFVEPCYKAYLCQLFSSAQVEQCWQDYPQEIALALEFFLKKFSTPQRIEEVLITETVDNPVLSELIQAINKTVRSNLRAQGSDVFVIKLLHGPLQDKKSLRETFVWSPEFEGVHFRTAPVARGGIRWSENACYRWEALELARVQALKNAIVVPAGAKGVFYIKTPTATASQVLSCYKSFISGLLDIMDNEIEGQKISAPSVTCYDPEDLYLVVAPDKGTGTFAAFANEIALEKGFWLGDAFASGGPTGYDHKKLGITSKGAWICLKEHLARLSIQPTIQHPLSVIGIGDMSGDVFGNGLLGSMTLQLKGAFDHRHIFLDPTPDPEKSYQERCRLFHLKGSSWADYNPEVLSSGGQIFDRHQKEVTLSPEAQAMLGLQTATHCPYEVIKALLKMPCDVMWMGGIGTYIKGSSENHQNLRDQGNDSVRVDGQDVKAKMIVEGANLGCTQEGRIEFWNQGGQINIDAIDNSGGVECSDHEVNFKILFSLNKDEVPLDERNQILGESASFVVQSILEDSYRQALAISSLQEKIYFEPLKTWRQTVSSVVGTEVWQNQNSAPSNRPDIAVAFCKIKLMLREALSDTFLKDSHWSFPLAQYFPDMIQERFAHLVKTHLLSIPLRRALLVNKLSSLLPSFCLQYLGCADQNHVQWFVENVLWMYERFEMWKMDVCLQQALYNHSKSYQLLELSQALVQEGLILRLQHPNQPAQEFFQNLKENAESFEKSSQLKQLNATFLEKTKVLIKNPVQF